MSAFGPERTFHFDAFSLSRVKRTCPFALHISACDPKRTLTLPAMILGIIDDCDVSQGARAAKSCCAVVA